MEVGTKVQLPDGKVGNISSINEDGDFVVDYGDSVEKPGSPGRFTAVIKSEVFKKKDLKTEWIEGPDEFERFWDQDGNQVVFQPKGKPKVIK